MEALKRLDIAGAGDVFVVAMESEFRPPEPTIVVVPLLRDYPAVTSLNPTIYHDGTPYVLATRLITAARRASLKHVGNAKSQADLISRAVDILLTGF